MSQYINVEMLGNVTVIIIKKKKITNKTFVAKGECCQPVFDDIIPPEGASLIDNCCVVKKTCFEVTEQIYYVLEAGNLRYFIRTPPNASACLQDFLQNVRRNPSEWVWDPPLQSNSEDDGPDWLDAILESIANQLSNNLDPVTVGDCSDPASGNGYYAGSGGQFLPEPENCAWDGYMLVSTTESEKEISREINTYGPYNLGYYAIESPCEQNFN